MMYKYLAEVQPERGIQSNFASGQINYKWSMNQNMFNPAKSYIRIKIKLTIHLDHDKFNKNFLHGKIGVGNIPGQTLFVMD